MSDKQAEQDALRAKRATEAYEREWRRKEKESAQKHLIQETELRQERIRQQQAREIAIASEATKLKEEFFSALERQKQVEAKLKAEEELKALKNREYAKEIQAQIHEKQLLKEKKREEVKLENLAVEQKRKEQKEKIEMAKTRKLKVTW